MLLGLQRTCRELFAKCAKEREFQNSLSWKAESQGFSSKAVGRWRAANWCSAEQLTIHVHLDRENRLISQEVLDEGDSCQIPLLYPSSPHGDTSPFIPWQLSFPGRSLVSIPSQGFGKESCISLSSDLGTAPRKHSVLVRMDSPCKKELGILFQLFYGDTDAK